MHVVVEQIIASLDAIDPERIKSNAMRRFREAIEVPLTSLLGLHVPTNARDIENVYVTWVDAQNNIDNRMWQVQNKLLKNMYPRIAVGLCSEDISQDTMWVESARNLSRIAPYLSRHNFEGLLLLSTADERETFQPRRLILLKGGHLASEMAKAVPELTAEWYSVPLATRRPNVEGSTNSHVAEFHTMLRAHRNVILEGVSGIGKSFVIGPLMDQFDEAEFAVFHPSTSYEDFVEALRPIGGGHFSIVDGRFYAFCRKAAANPDKEFLFVIDEINRAPAARVLGDLLYSIDPSKRINAAVANEIFSRNDESAPLPEGLTTDSRPVQLQYERQGPNGPFRALFCVPDNVYILGTRNTSDHSIGSMDIALSRRFKSERLEPLAENELIAVLSDLDERLAFLKSEVAAWAAMNAVLARVSPDACLGHSYFFDALRAVDNIATQDDEQTINEVIWRDCLLPQLSAVLLTFDAGHLLPALQAAASLSASLTGNYWLDERGEGLSVSYLVRPRPGWTVLHVDLPALGTVAPAVSSGGFDAEALTQPPATMASSGADAQTAAAEAGL